MAARRPRLSVPPRLLALTHEWRGFGSPAEPRLSQHWFWERAVGGLQKRVRRSASRCLGGERAFRRLQAAFSRNLIPPALSRWRPARSSASDGSSREPLVSPRPRPTARRFRGGRDLPRPGVAGIRRGATLDDGRAVTPALVRRPARITWPEAAISPRSNGDAEISAEEHQEKKRETDCGGWRAFPMPPLENAERAEKLHSGSGCVPVNSKPIKLFVRGS